MSYKIGIIGAMEIEVESLKKKMTVSRTLTKANMEFNEGKIGNTEVIVVKSGICKVNAALCVQILVDDFKVTHVINTGAAGSLDAKIDIGDFVVSTDAVYHDVDATIFGYKKGEIPQTGCLAFQADAWMVENIRKAADTANITGKLWDGRVCSGDQFISDNSVKDTIKKEFDGLCCEMEGCGIAQACFLNKIPFVILRAISDKADGSDIMDYPEFEKKAAKDSAALTEAFIMAI
ncbi:5'-methylthioadenosine/adenosylhomocysteine nucleosidase [Butyrivibrio sp. INlla16]|uniref:5'-methylthioadenosine/adenosylhomocysteine nucleosidase n=1 Tax=Butyrivibrio sp. INlla16 TaxID=1520807 RepID=UPI000881868D|nr:5'-methylthioadenosine/adenosylhomocysteine nucleosidase [Butyrivibrio sp. INlla16]SDB61129.1 adenosylhomocysteine nucleosidase [Butyrivibrio sp. INlla16]